MNHSQVKNYVFLILMESWENAHTAFWFVVNDNIYAFSEILRKKVADQSGIYFKTVGLYWLVTADLCNFAAINFCILAMAYIFTMINFRCLP